MWSLPLKTQKDAKNLPLNQWVPDKNAKKRKFIIFTEIGNNSEICFVIILQMRGGSIDWI